MEEGGRGGEDTDGGADTNTCAKVFSEVDQGFGGKVVHFISIAFGFAFIDCYSLHILPYFLPKLGVIICCEHNIFIVILFPRAPPKVKSKPPWKCSGRLVEEDPPQIPPGWQILQLRRWIWGWEVYCLRPSRVRNAKFHILWYIRRRPPILFQDRTRQLLPRLC